MQSLIQPTGAVDLTYLGGPNVLSRSTNTTSLDSTLGIYTKIPSGLNEILDLEDGWNGPLEILVAVRFDPNNV